MKKNYTLLLLLLAAISLHAQHRQCATMDNLQEQLATHPEMQQTLDDQEKHTQRFEQMASEKTIITIPVVFHIIHNGDAVGSGENISDALILAQLEQMNDDFALLNSDANLIPAAFAPLAANTMIQFCLAERTPDCQATTGINRINGGQASWTRTAINSTLKPATIWDRDQYLNIWTVVFGGADAGLLGYAQFPGGAASTDGVVVVYSSVGSLDLPNPNGGSYDSGRTMTHEVGHWLNLRHIWGDDDLDMDTCAGSDFVADTPNQALPNGGCPPFPWVTCGNGPNGDMHMNYMDYTNDDCLQMFTSGQSTRMRAVLESGGLRASLANSLGCVPLGVCYCNAAANDLAANEKISNVSFADINQSSSSNAGYENYINVKGNVEQEATYSLSVTLSNPFSTDQVIVWIDYNQDGDFVDMGEQVFTSVISTGPFNSNITIPATALTGETRMRVRLHDTSLGPNATSCGNSNYGQVEDYTLVVTAPLPVEFLSFKARATADQKAHIAWTTANERNVKAFVAEIASEHSPSAFDAIGELPPNSSRQYSITSEKLENGLYYCRVKELDFEGNTSYSIIQTVSIEDGQFKFKLAPNPADGFVRLEWPGETNDESSVTVLNQLGQVCYHQPIAPQSASVLLPLHGLPSGLYYVRWQTGTNRQVERLRITNRQ